MRRNQIAKSSTSLSTALRKARVKVSKFALRRTPTNSASTWDFAVASELRSGTAGLGAAFPTAAEKDRRER